MRYFMDSNTAAPGIRDIYSCLPIFIAFAVTVCLSFTQYVNLIWIQIPFHSAIEASGAIIAIILSALLLSSSNEYPQDFFKVIISSALITMGVLDLSHSFVEPGQTFVWLHTIATLLGGVIFSLVWLPYSFRQYPHKITIPFLILGCCLLLVAVVLPEKMPLMLHEGDFTFTAQILNLVGGIGFFIGSAWFFKNKHHSHDQNLTLFANHCLLFGISAVLFDFSRIWDMAWWAWHAFRLVAYLVALLLIFKIHIKSAQEKDKTLAEALLFRETLDEVSAHIYMKDSRSRYVYANRPTLELFKCSADEVIGRDDSHFFPPDTAKLLRAIDLRVLAGEKTSEEINVESSGTRRRVYLEVKAPISARSEDEKLWVLGISTDITDRKQNAEEREKLLAKLEKSLDEIKTLHGILPICMHCKGIRDDKGSWNILEKYISEHSEAQFSHGICDKCKKEHYPEMAD